VKCLVAVVSRQHLSGPHPPFDGTGTGTGTGTGKLKVFLPIFGRESLLFGTSPRSRRLLTNVNGFQLNFGAQLSWPSVCSLSRKLDFLTSRPHTCNVPQKYLLSTFKYVRTLWILFFELETTP